jgi:hypothetical protein
MLRVLTLSIAATGCGIQRTRRRTISQCPLENQSSFTAHRNLTTEKCIVGSLIHTYPLDVSLCVSKVGGQEHSDLTLGTRLAGLTFWSRWPFVDDGVAILRLHSRQMGVLADPAHCAHTHLVKVFSTSLLNGSKAIVASIPTPSGSALIMF